MSWSWANSGVGVCEIWSVNTEHSCLLSPVSCLLSHSWRLVSVGEGRGYASLPHTTHSAQLDRRLGSLFSRLPDNPDMRLFSWQVADCCFHHGPRVTATDSWTMGPAATKQNSRPEENWGDYCPTLSYTGLHWLLKNIKILCGSEKSFLQFSFLESVGTRRGQVPAWNMNWPIEPFARFE